MGQHNGNHVRRPGLESKAKATAKALNTKGKAKAKD